MASRENYAENATHSRDAELPNNVWLEKEFHSSGITSEQSSDSTVICAE
jgi:hypothetical protein